MPRDPYTVLGVDPGASQETIKAAWRRLARVHHPDLTGDEPAAARRATRQMAEINAAYESVRSGPKVRRATAGDRATTGARPTAGARGAGQGSTNGRAAAGSRTGPPSPRPTRPVTARVDTTATYRARNQTLGGSRNGPFRAGWPPLRTEPLPREPLRASDPTGPLRRGRVRGFRPPVPPALADALAVELQFGKFHGHTLGQVAAFEPSYIDWIAGMIARDPELVAAARVVRADLDRRGVVRRRHARPVEQRGDTRSA